MIGFNNILLIQLGDIGDVVLTSPTIRAAKESYPAARISILVFKPYGSLLAADPDVYEVIETSRSRGSPLRRLRASAAFARNLRQKKYDLVIDLRTGDRGAILSFLTGAQVRVGYRGTQKLFWHKILFTKIIRELKIAPPPVHPGADQALRIVREIGIDTMDSIPRLHITQNDLLRSQTLLEETGIPSGSRIVTINPFSRWKYKEWNLAKWRAVIDHIWESHRISTVLIGSPEEASASQLIIAGQEGRAISLAGKTTLSELAATISLSSLHIGVDSAAPHIAAAVGTPTVTIHGPSDWRAWRIVSDLHKVVIPVMGCVPCNRRGCDDTELSQCLEQLGTDAVIEAIDSVLQKLNGLRASNHDSTDTHSVGK